MAEKKNITRAQALESAIALVKESAAFDDTWNDVTEVLEKMLAQLTKPRKATVSKARKVNENLAEWVYNNAPEDTITTKDVVNLGDPNITTTQKASAVLRVGTEMGFFEKVTDGKKVAYHKIAE